MLSIIRHLGNANLNHSELPLHIHRVATLEQNNNNKTLETKY